MPRTGFIDHIGIGVPDLAAAKKYYDELMPILGLKQWFPTTPDGIFNYGPDGARGPQIFFYQALEPTNYSRHNTGLQHLCFMVATRAIVREAYEWALSKGAEIVDVPRDHVIFQQVLNARDVPQIPGIGYWDGADRTWERSPRESKAYYRAIYDANGRIMVLMTFDTDFGDSYEGRFHPVRFLRSSIAAQMRWTTSWPNSIAPVITASLSS